MSNQPHKQDPPLTDQELDALTRQRRVLIKQRLTTHTSNGQNLLTILDTPHINTTIEDLLAALAALCTLTDPHQSADWQRTRSPNTGSQTPSFTPAWADRKLAQIDRQLYELAGNIDAWTTKPHDPERPDLCRNCGRKRERDHHYCRTCGTGTHQTLRQVTKTCEHCGTGFVPMRSDARYCSGRCRLAAHRRRDETDETDSGNPSG